MASLGGWIRFFVGIVLAAEVLRDWLFGSGSLSIYALGLAGLLLGLSALYFIFRF